MIANVPEKFIRRVRWILTIGWFILIFSLFYDPISPYFTRPEATWSILHLNPKLLDPQLCHQVLEVQGKCLEEQPYTLAPTIFWGLVIPCAITILLVFGHEFWRRICPLSFLSQIPRALGKQRQRKIVNSKTGAVRYELAKINKDSWLSRNYLYFQFGLLCIGLASRILFFNSDHLALGLFLLFTIASAIFVGYWFGGKTWCQYFCPMAPVQMVYTGPRGLLGSEAHQGEKKSITQSMCRTVDTDNREKSVCVGCQSPCIDIDAERSYWEILKKPGRKFAQYGYVGLVVSFYLYYFLYSGTWDYYYSGAWAHDEKQLAKLFDPGFYINHQAIPIPKLIAVPLTLSLGVFFSYFLINKLEKAYRAYLLKKKKDFNQQQVIHRIFVGCTFVAFNYYYIFGGRPLLNLLPISLQWGFNTLVVFVSTIWLYRTLKRSNEVYSRESLADSLRRQLSKLNLDFSQYLEGRSMKELKPDEVYVLAKVLPNFHREQGIQVYKGMLRETLEQGIINSADSLEKLKEIRLELGVKEEEHFKILNDLGLENPDLFNSNKIRSREQQLRIENYRQSLELQLLELIETGVPVREALKHRQKQVQSLKQEYGITNEEEERILAEIFEKNNTLLRTVEFSLSQLKKLTIRHQVLNQLIEQPEGTVFVLLQKVAVEEKQKVITRKLLSILEALENSPEAIKISRSLAVLAENILPDLLQETYNEVTWEELLHPEVINLLKIELPETTITPIELVFDESDDPTILPSLQASKADEIASQHSKFTLLILEEILEDLDPTIRALSLWAIAQLDTPLARQHAQQLLNGEGSKNSLIKETAERLLKINQSNLFTQDLGTIDKLLLLSNSSFSQSLNLNALIELARSAVVQDYPSGTILCTQGDASNEILLMIEGAADVTVDRDGSPQVVNTIKAGETLGEMGVLTRQKRSANVITTAPQNRVLIIEAQKFETVLYQEPLLSRNLILILSRRLQRLTAQVQSKS